MNKRRLILILAAVLASTTVLAVGNRVRLHREQSTSSDATNAKAQQSASDLVTQSGRLPQDKPAKPAAGDIPKHIVYGLLFREMAAFKKKGEELRAQGKDDVILHRYHQQKANLDEFQATALEKIADDVQREVEDLELEAKRIIDADRALHPGGRLKPGEILPEPPKRLKELEDKRTELILEAREKLRLAFGEAEFRRFDEFQQQDVAERAQRIERSDKPGDRSRKTVSQ